MPNPDDTPTQIIRAPRSISESTEVRARIGRAVAWVAVIVTGAFSVGAWATAMHLGQGDLERKVQDTKDEVDDFRREVRGEFHALRSDVREIQRAVSPRSAAIPSMREPSP